MLVATGGRVRLDNREVDDAARDSGLGTKVNRMSAVNELRVTRAAVMGPGAVTKTAHLVFDEAGKLASGTVQRELGVHVFVPAPPFGTVVHQKLSERAIDVGRSDIQELAVRMRSVASSDAAGGVTDLEMFRKGRFLRVTTTDPQRQFGMHLPGEPTRVDQHVMRRDDWGPMRPATQAVTELTELGAQLLKRA